MDVAASSKQVTKMLDSLVKAVDFVSKVGRAQHHFGKEVGKVSSLKLQVTIGHQENPGDTNYWTNSEFDLALAHVVQQSFKPLAARALDLMREQYVTANIGLKAELKEALALIEHQESQRTLKGAWPFPTRESLELRERDIATGADFEAFAGIKS